MDNVISGLLPNLLMSGRRLQRSYTVGPAGSTSVQVVSAMLLQMLQVRTVHISTCDHTIAFMAALMTLIHAILGDS